MLTTTPIVAQSTIAPPHAMRDVWRASELAICRSTTITTGHAAIDPELPNDGWPRSALVELLVQQHGIGEMQLLKPALVELASKQRVALVQPPFIPHSMACRAWHINERNVLWLRPQSSADALWATEQILKNGSCGGVILWQTNVRPESLRRLNLAAQSAETWLWLIRPLAAAADASPSPLRIALRPALGGISAEIVKRRGPHCDAPIFVPLLDMPANHQNAETDHETDVKRAPATTAVRSFAAALV